MARRDLFGLDVVIIIIINDIFVAQIQKFSKCQLVLALGR